MNGSNKNTDHNHENERNDFSRKIKKLATGAVALMAIGFGTYFAYNSAKNMNDSNAKAAQTALLKKENSQSSQNNEADKKAQEKRDKEAQEAAKIKNEQEALSNITDSMKNYGSFSSEIANDLGANAKSISLNESGEADGNASPYGNAKMTINGKSFESIALATSGIDNLDELIAKYPQKLILGPENVSDSGKLTEALNAAADVKTSSSGIDSVIGGNSALTLNIGHPAGSVFNSSKIGDVKIPSRMTTAGQVGTVYEAQHSMNSTRSGGADPSLLNLPQYEANLTGAAMEVYYNSLASSDQKVTPDITYKQTGTNGASATYKISFIGQMDNNMNYDLNKPHFGEIPTSIRTIMNQTCLSTDGNADKAIFAGYQTGESDGHGNSAVFSADNDVTFKESDGSKLNLRPQAILKNGKVSQIIYIPTAYMSPKGEVSYVKTNVADDGKISMSISASNNGSEFLQ